MNDEEWHKNVDEHLLRDLVEDLQERIADHDEDLRGNRNNPGLLNEYRRHDEMLTRLYATVFQDAAGKKGLAHDVAYLMDKRSNREKASGYKWDFWKSILVAMIMSGAITTLINQWPAIKKMLPKDHPGPLEQKIEQARRPKSKRKIYRYRISSAPAPGAEAESKENPPLPPPPLP